MEKKIIQTAGRNALGDFAPEFAHYNDDILFVEDIFDFLLKIAFNFDLDIIGFRGIKMENFRDDISKMKDLYNYNLLDNSIIHQPELSTWMVSKNGHYQLHDVTIWAKCIKSKI